MQPSLMQRLWAELLGTWFLVLIGCGAVAAATKLGGSLDVAGLFAIALSFGIAVTTMIYTIGHISGCHINPAVSVALAVTGRMPWSQALAYSAFQCLGALGGAVTLTLVFGGTPGNLGATTVASGFSPWQAYLAEAVGTFVLVFTIFGTAVDGRAPQGWAGWTIGLVVAGIIVALGVVSGAGINPARVFGPYLVTAVAGAKLNWTDFIVGYVVAPLVGAIAAAFVYDALAGGRAHARQPERAAS